MARTRRSILFIALMGLLVTSCGSGSEAGGDDDVTSASPAAETNEQGSGDAETNEQGSGDAETNEQGSGDAETVEVGYSGALTGGAAAWGIGVAEGMKSAFADAGVVDVGGSSYEFELVAYDDEYSVETATTNARRLVQEHGVNFAATMGGAIGEATEPVFSEANVLQLHLGASDGYLGADKPLSLRTHNANLDAFYVYWTWVEDNYPEAETVAFFEPDDDTGQASREHEEAAIATTSLDISSFNMVSRDVNDFYPILTSALDKGPDILSAASVPPGQQAILAKQARELGFEGPIILPSLDVDAVVDALGGDTENILNTIAITFPTTEWAEEVQDDYRERSGEEPSSTFLDGYNMGWMLVNAIEAAGTVEDAEAVNEAMHALDFSETVHGTMCWHEVNGINNAMLGPVPISVIEDGEEELLDVAEADC